MRLARKTNHDRRTPQELQRAEHLFSTALGWSPIICLAENEHHGCLDILNVGKRRALYKILRILKWRSLEPRWLEEREVSAVPPCSPACDVTLRDASGESVRVPDDPIGKQSATASAGDAELLRVDVAAFDHLINAGHEVAKIIA